MRHDTKAIVLLVDDEPKNLRVLGDCLLNTGMDVLVAQNGEDALKCVIHRKPDLIVLDVMMPGIGGYETCRRLKANAAIADIPVLFMTALADTQNKVKGFKVGAVDYIVKPFQVEEVLARIETHLTLQRLRKERDAQNAELRREIEERKRAEEALQQSEKRMHRILHGAPVGIGMVKNQDIVFANPEMTAMLGYSEHQLLGKSARILYPSDAEFERVGHYKNPLLKTVGTASIETQLLCQDGTVLDVLMSTSVIDPLDIDAGYISSVINITDRKQTEEALQTHQLELEMTNDQLEMANVQLEVSNEELRLTQIQLVESRQKYLDLYDFAPVGYCTIDHEGRILEANLTAATLVGKERNGLISNRVYDYVVEADRDRSYLRLQQLVNTHARQTFEVGLLTADGAECWAQLDAIMFEESRYHITLTDITNRKQAEETVKRSENQLREIANTIPGMIYQYIQHPDGSFTLPFISEHVQTYTGYTPDDIMSAPLRLFESLHPDDVSTVETAIAKSISTRKNYAIEQRLITPDGTLKWFTVEATPHFLPNGDILWNGVTLDITDRKQAEESLRDSEKRYKMLFEGAAEGILVTDAATTQFRYANPAICRLLGYSEQELTRMAVNDIHPEEALEWALTAFEALVLGDIAATSAMPCVCRDKRVFYADIQASVVELDGIPCVVGFFTDVTERKQAEEQVRNLAKFPDENPNPVLRVAHDGTILYANKRSRSLLDAWKAQETRLLPDAWNALILDVLRSNSHKNTEIEVEDRILSLTFAPVVNEAYVNIYGLDITTRKHAEEALRENTKHIRNIFENVPIGMFQSTPEGKFVYVNYAISAMLGYASPDELLQTVNRTSIADVLYESPERRPLLVQQVEQGRNRWDVFENRYRRKDGRIIDALLAFGEHADPLTGQRVLYGFVQDITDHKRAEEQIKANLQEKEVLLREIYHRVKNNLMVVTSLIQMQAEETTNSEALDLFRDLYNRVLAMSMVHEDLYQSDNLAQIDFGIYLERLVNNIRQGFAKASVGITVVTDNLFLDVQKAIPCGLIVAELVTNAFKYAFPISPPAPFSARFLAAEPLDSPSGMGKGWGAESGGNSVSGTHPSPSHNTVDVSLEAAVKKLPPVPSLEKRGEKTSPERGRAEIRVEMRYTKPTYILSVSDNGVGLPPEFDIDSAKTLGLTLVRSWATHQLKGEIKLDSQQGTHCIITFSERGLSTERTPLNVMRHA